MNSLRHNLCSTLAVLYVIALAPTFGQEHPSPDASSPNPSQPVLTLHKVDLPTKIKWGAQWLFYPESLDSVRTLHAYNKRVCTSDGGQTAESTENLGFVVEASSTREEVPRTGQLIDGSVRNTETVTLNEACESFRSNDNSNAIFLSRYPIPNQDQNHIGLFWTSVSEVPAGN